MFMNRGDWPYTNWWMVKRHLPKPPATILDLGCGTGAPMQYFNRNGGYKVFGIDAHAPHTLRQRILPGIPVYIIMWSPGIFIGVC